MEVKRNGGGENRGKAKVREARKKTGWGEGRGDKERNRVMIDLLFPCIDIFALKTILK